MESPEQMESQLWDIYERYDNDDTRLTLLSQWIEITTRYIAVWRDKGYEDYVETAEKFIAKCKDKQKQLGKKLN